MRRAGGDGERSLIDRAGATVVLLAQPKPPAWAGRLHKLARSQLRTPAAASASVIDGRTLDNDHSYSVCSCGGATWPARMESVVTADGAMMHPQARPVLAGRHVRLRPGDRDDSGRLHAILAEPSVARWWGEPDPAAVIEEKLRGPSSAVLLVVEIGGRVADGIQYQQESDPRYRHAGIDVYLGSRYQGHGAGCEAVGLLAGFLFSQRGHHRITIDPAAANDRAIRCYAKVGFRPVGVLRQYERGDDGQFHDGLLMELLSGDLTSRW